MKFLFCAVLLFISVTCNNADKTPLDKDKEECITELNLDRKEMLKLEELDLPPDTNADYNKFVECDSKKKGLMTPSGEILFSGIKKLLFDQPEVKNIPTNALEIFKNIISKAMKVCEEKPLSSNSPGKNMINVHACVYNELLSIKKLLV